MSLFSAALGGVGESMQGMARTYIKEESAANLATLEAELAKQKASFVADLQRRRDDYLVSPEYSAREATAAGAKQRAVSQNTAFTLSPGQQRHLGDEYVENDRPTGQEVTQSLYESGLRTAGSARPAAAGKPPAAAPEGLDLKHIEQARKILKGSPFEEQLAANGPASSMFDQLVSHNRNMTPAQAAQLAIEATASNDPEAVKKNPKMARRSNSIMFDASGRPFILPTITDGEGNEYHMGGTAQKPATKNDVAKYLNETLVPRAATTGPTKDLGDKVDYAIRFLGMEPDQFQALVDEFRGKRRAEEDAKREAKPERRAPRKPAREPVPADQPRMAPQYEGGMYLDDGTM